MRINAPLAGSWFLRPDVAIADAEEVVYGSTVWPAPSFVTFVPLKEDGRWQIASSRYAPSTFRSLSSLP